jgi:PAS domain S-box-containing protein
MDFAARGLAPEPHPVDPIPDARCQDAERIAGTRRALHHCAQTIIRAYSEEALLGEICLNLHDSGNYSTVWIGLVTEHGVQPVAQVGAPRGFFEGGVVAGVEGTRDGSVVGRAVREQRPQVLQDIPKNATARHLRDHALRFKYRGVCVFPLRFGPQGSAVLCLYAPDPDAFGIEEVSLLRRLAGDVADGLSALRDKNNRERLEEDLERAERHFRAIIENAREGIFQSTMRGKLQYANAAFAKLLGFPSAGHLFSKSGATLADFVDAEGLHRLVQAVDAPSSAGPIELRIRRIDGSFVWVSASAQRVETENGPALQGFIQDMTAIRAEREASARLAALIDATQDAIVALGPTGEIRSWNPGAQALYGYTPAEATGRSVVELLVPEETLPRFREMIATANEAEPSPYVETTHKRKDGSRVHVAVAMSPILDADREVVGTAMTSHDLGPIRRAREAEKALELQESEVNRLMELQRVRVAFINEASHELKTPLTPIRAHLELLRETPDIPDRVRKSIHVLHRNVLRLESLVKDMLDASKLEAGRLRLEVRPLSLRRLIRHVIASFAHQATKLRVRVVTEDITDALIAADSARITQVLFNLLSNALKFTPSGGTVRIGATERSDGVTVTVNDTGVGLAPDQAQDLFKPFGSFHVGVHGQAQGTGLGLFISKAIVEQHGGRMWTESAGLGQGTRVSFFLPKGKVSAVPEKTEDLRSPTSPREPAQAA